MNEELTDVEKQQLINLLHAELVEALEDEDIQGDCYEHVYDDFITDVQELTDEYDKLILSFFREQWELRRLLIVNYKPDTKGEKK